MNMSRPFRHEPGPRQLRAEAVASQTLESVRPVAPELTAVGAMAVRPAALVARGLAAVEAIAARPAAPGPVPLALVVRVPRVRAPVTRPPVVRELAPRESETCWAAEAG